MLRARVITGLCLVTWLLAACEPASVTEARLQLGRGGERITGLTIPITQDTLAISDFLSDTTSINGLVGVNFGADSVNVDVGNQLKFDNITLTGITVDVPSGGFAAGGTFAVPPVTYSVLSGEPRLLAIDSIVAQSGSLSITTQNRLPGSLDYTLTLNGFRDGNGAILSQSATVPASPNDGTYSSSTMTFDLAGVTITPGTPVSATLSGSITVPPGTNPAYGTSAVIQSGTGDMVVQSLKGTLDPGTTPELAVALENSQEIPSTSVDFGDFEDAVQSSTLNSAVIALTVINTSQAPVVLSSFSLGAVKLDGSGQLLRDGLGNPDFERDASNNPILVAIADPGLATFTIGRAANRTVSINAAPLIDRVAKLAIAGQRFAVVTTGTAAVGDGATSRIVRTDFIKVRFQMTVGLDVTVPLQGVSFTRTEVSDGLGLEAADADDLTSRIQQASMSAVVTNGTPFGVSLQLVLAGGAVAPGVDIFTLPGRVTLDSAVVQALNVDAGGFVTSPTTDSVSVGISGADARLLFNDQFSVGARIRLFPSASSGGRGAVRPTDRVIINARAQVDVKSGGSQ